MNREEFKSFLMDTANRLSKFSTCSRLNVGCLIVSSDHKHILSWGFNGNASGLDNKCDQNHPGNCGCIHAETNAIINYISDKTLPKDIYCTHLPCVNCAKQLINLGNIKHVYFQEWYRSKDSIGIFRKAGIRVFKYNPK